MNTLCVFIVSAFLISSCTQKKSAPDPIVEESKKLRRANLPKDEQTENYFDWLQRNSVLIPEKHEQKFLIGYVKYLRDGDPMKGQKLIKLLKDVTTKKKNKLPVAWLSIFEGHHKLVYLGTSLGVLSSKRLLPLIKFGDPTAIELVLIYSAAVATDGADAEGLEVFRDIVIDKYSEILAAARKKNANFLDKYPSNI